MRIFLISVISVFLSNTVNANDSLNSDEPLAPVAMYWIGGSGMWNDYNNWATTSGGTVTTGFYPDNNTIAIIDVNSGLSSTDTITIPTGIYEVSTLKVFNNSGFTLLMDGTNFGNNVQMSIYEDISINSNFNLRYGYEDIYSNKWKFVGAGTHALNTGSHDLLHVEFFTAGGTYTQITDLTASLQIRMHGGTWIADGHDVYTDYLYFRDTNGSGNPIPKQFSADVTNIYCSEWDSKFAYQSLVVTGNHTIYTSRFSGSPGSQFNNFSFNNIHLLEFPDTAPGGFSQIEYNNFDCSYCEIQNLIIEDHGRTQLAGKFTIAANLTVINQESTILFNGGNGRISEVAINGSINVPVPIGCNKRTIFSNIYNDFSTIKRPSGVLTLPNSFVNNIHTSGGATFNVSNGALQGSSTGWNLINNPTPINYEWNGPASGYGDWDNPANWVVANQGSNGCYPRILDNVAVKASSTGNIRIPAGFEAECNNFDWQRASGILFIDGVPCCASTMLKVGGDFEIHSAASTKSNGIHYLQFETVGTKKITTNGVELPKIRFNAANGNWLLADDLECEELYFFAGAFNTQNNNITTNYWSSGNLVNYTFGSSHITVTGEMRLSTVTSNVTVNPGTSVIECEKLSSTTPVLYDVILTNPTPLTMDNIAYSFNSLTLQGIDQVSTQNALTLNDLIFKVNGSSLAVATSEGLIVNGGIRSFASSGNTGVLKSGTIGTSTVLDKTNGNLCVVGRVAFRDINAVLGGVLNAPLGVDNGGNTNINFDNGSTSNALYWIGNSGNWNTVSNWSRLSGGCPSNKNPASETSLVFDNNSFATSPATVDVTTSTCNDVFFRNFANATVEISSSLTAKNIFNDGGYVNFIGKNLFIDTGGEIKVENGGFFTSKMLNCTAPLVEVASGALVVKNGAKLTCDTATIHGTLVVESTGALITDTLDVFGTVTNSGAITVKQ